MLDISKSVVKKAQKLGAEDVIAQTIHSANEQIRFSQNEIDIAKKWNNTSVGVFLTYKKRVVATEIKNIDEIDATLETTMSFARASRENPDYGGIAQGPFKYRRTSYDKKIGGLENPHKFVFEAIDAALKEGAHETAGILYLTNMESAIATSTNVAAEDRMCGIELSIRAFSEEEASGHGVTVSSNMRDFEPKKAGQKAGRNSVLARNPKLGEEGKFNIIFDPMFAGSLVNNAMDMTSAFSVDTNLSMYVDCIGKPVASPIVSIYEDGTHDALGRRKYDDEGVPTQRNVVIEKGILKTYLHNTSTAKKFKTKTTANAGLVQPQAFNLILESGGMSEEEIFEECKSGLYLTNTWYTRFQNFRTGDFSTIPRDAILKVENGEIAGSLKNIRVSENLMELFKKICALGREQQQIKWWGETYVPTIVPFVYAQGVNITRSTE
jgi:PmbA protein